MPIAVALLCHPAGAYGFVVVTLGAFVYACQARTFVPAFTAFAAAALTALAFLHVPPSPHGLLLIGLGVALLQCELLLPTYGTALMAGIAACVGGSWLLLAPPHGATVVLATAPKLAVAVTGSLALLAAVLHGFRRRTLPPRRAAPPSVP
jgi:membrane-bound ClpP family serine protease